MLLPKTLPPPGKSLAVFRKKYCMFPAKALQVFVQSLA
jgi:hypothetical protein